MKKSVRFLAIVLSIVMLVGLMSGCGQTKTQATTPSDNGKVYKFTVATRAKESDLIGSTVSWFAKEIESRTNGRIVLDVQYNGVLCSQGTEFDALESGICDIAVASLSSNADRWPSLGWVIVPGMVNTYKEQLACLHAVQDAGYLDKELAQNDVHVLWWQPAECFNFALTKKKVETLKDLKGLKIGYAGGEYIGNTINATGATAVGTNAADFYMSLSTGVLDGFVNPARYMYDAQFYDVVKYMPTGITCGGSNNSVYMSNKAFNSLPSDLQKVFLQVCSEAEEHFIKTATDLYSNEYDLLTKKGCECYQLPQDVMDSYKSLCTSLSDKWVSAQKSSGNANASAIRDLVLKTAASTK
jgi:TRAP-type C4-dicarboxylate transport system substrate-binding protein